MRIVPNIGKPMRLAYVAIGAVLLMAPLAVALEDPLRIIVLALGGISIKTGAVGW